MPLPFFLAIRYTDSKSKPIVGNITNKEIVIMTPTTTVTVTVCKAQRISYSKKYVPEMNKKYTRIQQPVPVVEIAENRKRPFIRISDTIIKVKKG